MKDRVLEWGRTIVGVALFTFVMKTVAFATYYIPSESMIPTFEVGDRLIATKFDYGYGRYSTPLVTLPRLPVEGGRLFARLPERGDVVVFSHPLTGDVLVKRTVGLPGDRIQVTAGRLVINGTPAPRRKVRSYAYRQFRGPPVRVTEYEETLPNGVTHPIIVRSDHGPHENTPEYLVPPGHLFMMGDNRDNSADSRFPSLGFVPVENLIARSRAILYSFHTCRPEPGLTCAPRRFLTAVE